MNTAEIKSLNDLHVINTYGERKLALTRGEGARVWDSDGKEYLDFFAGIAVVNLGHAHPAVTAAIMRQAAQLIHVSNLYYIEPQVRLAALLSEHCFAQRWFFCNGGAEANEAAIKLSRRYWFQKGTPRPDIITAERSFHGRTLATVTATGQPKYHEGFAPLMPGFQYVPYGDLDALRAAATPEVGAIMLEPLQGEGGVRTAPPEYWQGVRALCDERNIILIFDEVQTGLGRTGTLFAYESLGMRPDIITLAKGLGNGVPIGAMGCTEELAGGFAPGAHACTFGGNPLSSSAALATVTELTTPGFLEDAGAVAKYFQEKLLQIGREHASIVEVRGKGFMLGVEFKEAVAPLIEKMIDAGVICGPAGPNVLRFVPPLIVSKEDVHTVVAKLKGVLGALEW